MAQPSDLDYIFAETGSVRRVPADVGGRTRVSHLQRSERYRVLVGLVSCLFQEKHLV